MSQRPFLAVLPKSMKPGDEVILKGKVSPDAREFSINFALENKPDPLYVAYHIKTIFDSNQVTVVQNYKNCGWMQEVPEDNNWMDGPGEEFIVLFHFAVSEIFIYTGDEEREMQYNYSHKFPIDSIQTVQVWGDVEKINELTFRYSD